ncbi:MAG: PfkB family carbohydrate kinase [Propionicimonas sp.]|nr:PfkB family carbohydrate kinase [Propionicimonas sp.]
MLRAGANKAFAAGKAVSAARGSLANGARPEVHVLLPDEGAEWYEAALHAEGMNLVSHRYPGIVRETVLVYEESGRVTVINGNGALVERERWYEFVRAVCARILPGGWVVCSGSFPPGIDEADITDFVTRVARAGGKLALDTGPAWLAAGIAGRPMLVSPNLAEAEAVLSRTDAPEPVEPGADALRRAELAAIKLQSRGVHYVTVTAGAAGVAWATPDGTGRLAGIEVEVRNPIGAGDAFMGGMVSWLEVGWSFPEAVRWGMATACAAIGQWSPGAASAEDAARYHARLSPNGATA